MHTAWHVVTENDSVDGAASHNKQQGTQIARRQSRLVAYDMHSLSLQDTSICYIGRNGVSGIIEIHSVLKAIL
jgi:hypothetical protein